MKPHVQIVRKPSPPPQPAAKPAAPSPTAAAPAKPETSAAPPDNGRIRKEKAFVNEVFRDKLLCVTLVNGTTIYGRIIFWDTYSFGLVPDKGGMPMLVHKQHLATVQPIEEKQTDQN